MTVVNASKIPEADQTPAPGKYLHMRCHIPPTMDDGAGARRGRQQTPLEKITVVDDEHHRVCWVNIDYPQWLLYGERWQALSISDGKTVYETREVFSGALAYFVQWFLGASLRKSFTAMADALQARCEGAES